MFFGTQRSWFVRPERSCKDVLGFQLESRRRIVDHVRSRNFTHTLIQTRELNSTNYFNGFNGLDTLPFWKAPFWN
jgi:hypothetical protein